MWGVLLSPYHNSDYKFSLEPGGIGSPNKCDFPATRIGEQTQSSHLRGLYCQWSQHFVGKGFFVQTKIMIVKEVVPTKHHLADGLIRSKNKNGDEWLIN